MTTPPFVVNKLPDSDATDVGLTQPIRFSVKDADTYIDAGQLNMTVGYALEHATGDHKFEQVMGRTIRSTTLPGPVDTNTEPTIVVVGGQVQITKTVTGNQNSTYFTKIAAGAGLQSVLATAVITPAVTSGQPGAVFGIENGTRNTGVYIILENFGGIHRIRMCGPQNSLASRAPNIVISFDWSGTKRYTLLWDEYRSKVDLYVVVSGATTLLHEEPISSFQAYDPIPGGTPHVGAAGDMTLVYGVEGTIGEQVTIGNVAITTNVGFPLIGIIRTGDFQTIRRSDESVRYEGGNPLTAPVSPWFGPDTRFFSSPDPNGLVTVLPSKAVRVTKQTSGDSWAIYREEPALAGTNTNGFYIEATFFGISEQAISGRISGMGIMVYDGQSVFFLEFLNGTPRQIGLLRKPGAVDIPLSYQTADIDWSSPVYFRFSMDPRRQKLDIWANDLTDPLLTVAFNRATLPSGADFGLSSTPFVAFGHTAALATTGSLDVSRLVYAPKYTAYEAGDGFLPDDVSTNPVWTRL